MILELSWRETQTQGFVSEGIPSAGNSKVVLYKFV